MDAFKGFPEGKVRLVPLPAQFFSDLLPGIDSLNELKLAVYVFWRLDHTQGSFRYFRERDIFTDELFVSGLSLGGRSLEDVLRDALASLVKRGMLLEAAAPEDDSQEKWYFLNSPRGRAAVKAILRGEWRSVGQAAPPLPLAAEPPNIFRLYEENIGPVTPLLAEAMAEAEDTYPESWIQDAFRIAVENNKRSWKYIQAILARWQQEGRDARKNRQDSEEARRRYAEWDTSDE
jgi:DnaD/phage-associated family protein